MVTSARDITIKTSRILRMSAILNGIRNPNCPDYNAHTGLSDWSCVNLIKYLSLSISCGPQTLDTNTESESSRPVQTEGHPSLLIVMTLVSGAHGLIRSQMSHHHQTRGHCALCTRGPIVRQIRTCRGYEKPVHSIVMHNEKCRDR